MIYFESYFPTPIGKIKAVASENELICLELLKPQRTVQTVDQTLRQQNQVLLLVEKWLKAYFLRQFKALPKIPLKMTGTVFQSSVWQAMTQIKPGQTVAYGHIAKRINKPKASRAVGGAANRNPFMLIVPCHRVVGSTGKLTGYAAGMKVKKWLLRHEGGSIRS